MTTFTYSKARQNFSDVLDQASKKGEIFIKRRDGSIFVIKPLTKTVSPLDVSSVDINISKREIVELIREIRER
ncbi:MAG: type II toxin-antitoxin system Phd/YefM family antitoxin [bacterium]|nr:type II toxin-antitoxin system Phd/YefM family antitoxin [bacterium]